MAKRLALSIVWAAALLGRNRPERPPNRPALSQPYRNRNSGSDAGYEAARLGLAYCAAHIAILVIALIVVALVGQP